MNSRSSAPMLNFGIDESGELGAPLAGGGGAVIGRAALEAPAPVLTAGETAKVEVRQEQLMAKESVDGRPPSHRQRTIGWRWIAVGVPVLLVCATAWAIMRGVSAGAFMGFGIALAAVLLLGGWPVWAAGLGRGREEAAARKVAVAEVHEGRGPA